MNMPRTHPFNSEPVRKMMKKHKDKDREKDKYKDKEKGETNKTRTITNTNQYSNHTLSTLSW